MIVLALLIAAVLSFATTALGLEINGAPSKPRDVILFLKGMPWLSGFMLCGFGAISYLMITMAGML